MTRKRQITGNQMRTLEYVSRFRQGTSILDLIHAGSKTLTTMAQDGLVSVRVKITQKGQEVRQSHREPRP